MSGIWTGMVHFFLYDYKFERVWKHPDQDVEKLKRYRAILSPDFSMYREMLRRIEPERIIYYNEPFSEMEGNIVFINYELSSWEYQSEGYTLSKYLAYIFGEQPLPASSKIHIKSGCVLRENKGMGSAQGGPWQPHKPEDEQFIGKPGEIKPSRAGGKHGGYSHLKIGDDGKATVERHGADHFSPGSHTDPYDHPIDWTDGFPHLGPPINISRWSTRV